MEGGKTTTAQILAFECVLRGRTNPSDKSLPTGHSIMVFSSVSLAQDVYEKASESSIELFSGEVIVQQYTRAMSKDERRTVRESFQSIDLLIITRDYYYRTLMKWSHHMDKENCNEDRTNFLLKPTMVFMDEIDFMDNYTVTSASMMAVTWQVVNPEGVLVSKDICPISLCPNQSKVPPQVVDLLVN